MIWQTLKRIFRGILLALFAVPYRVSPNLPLRQKRNKASPLFRATAAIEVGRCRIVENEKPLMPPESEVDTGTNGEREMSRLQYLSGQESGLRHASSRGLPDHGARQLPGSDNIFKRVHDLYPRSVAPACAPGVTAHDSDAYARQVLSSNSICIKSGYLNS